MSNHVPIIIGVGEFKNASLRMEDALEPLELMLRAIQAALQDATSDGSGSIVAHADSVSVIASSTWPYNDLPSLVANRLNIQPSHKAYSELAGSSPVQLVDDTARLVAQGSIRLGVVVGGEARASLKTFINEKKYPPPWTSSDNSSHVYYANDTDTLEGIGRAHHIGVPMQIYAMYENGLRAKRKQSPRENLAESARLYGKFSQIASKNPMAWNRKKKKPETVETIGTITKRNRMICFPYPLLMNAFNDVNLAGACLVTSVEFAERLGISRDKWIFLLGGGRAADSPNFWNRPNFHSSPAVATALDMCLESSGLGKDDMDLFDFYSCFPIVPKMACRHLGLSYENPTKPITLLGGLTSFGGAGANYSMHAVAEMVRQLRKTSDRTTATHGLILANGGTLTTENAICLSTQPRQSSTSYPLTDTLPSRVRKSLPPAVDVKATGEAVIETYTVEYDRENRPRLGHVVCILRQNGHRVIANHGDGATLEQLALWDREPIGRSGTVWPSPDVEGKNLFVFPVGSRL